MSSLRRLSANLPLDGLDIALDHIQLSLDALEKGKNLSEVGAGRLGRAGRSGAGG